MNILDLIEERKSKMRFIHDKNSAVEIFDKQKEAIK